MKSPRSQLDRFVSALHRRLLVVRALETAALGAAGGCAVGAALIPLLYWRDVPALPPTLGAVLLGAAAGLIWGLTHAPTKLQAATEADRQLNLADLLGTALEVGKKSRDSDRGETSQPWLQTVLSLADAACRNHTPSDVILHRLHARAWAGVAIAAALVVSLAALTTPEPAARAASTDRGARMTAQALQEETTEPAGGANNPAPSRPQGPGPEREGQAASGATTNPSEEDTATGDAADSSAQSTATSNTGQGGGTARANHPPVNLSSPPPSPTRQAPPSPTGDPATGTAPATAPRPSTGDNAPGTTTGTTTGTTPAASPAPPWQSPTWRDDARRAHEAIDSNRVPDARRQLIREYFDRP